MRAVTTYAHFKFSNEHVCLRCLDLKRPWLIVFHADLGVLAETLASELEQLSCISYNNDSPQRFLVRW